MTKIYKNNNLKPHTNQSITHINKLQKYTKFENSPNIHRFLGQVTSLSHISDVNKHIKEKLTPQELDMFRKEIIFGQFVDLDMMFYRLLVHYFMLREVADTPTDSISRALLLPSRRWSFCQ